MRKTASLALTVLLLLSVLGTLAAPATAAATTYYVNATRGNDSNNCRSPFTACLTITAAIGKASNGDTISVAAGTYDEQVVITKSLTLRGSGGTTIVKPSSVGKLTTILGGDFGGTTKQIAGIIVANVASGASVTVKTLKVDGGSVSSKPAGADYVAGVFYRETGGVIDTATLVNVRIGTGTDIRGDGIYLSAVTNTVTVEVKGSTITNFDKNGIDAYGSTLTANIHDNTITGRGPLPSGDEIQNGVVIGGGTAGTVNRNRISELAYQPETWWSAGIMFYEASGSAGSNTITHSQIGVIYQDGSGSASSNTVTGGTVGLLGLWAQYYTAGTWTVSFVGNVVSGARDSPGYQNAAVGAQTYADASLTITISNNQLTGGGSTSADGIYIGDVPANSPLGTITATIKNNVISGWQHGIHLVSSVTGATITGNTIQNNLGAESGVHVEPAVTATNVHVNFNNIVGNIPGVFNGAAGTLDAKNNWWGCKNGPGASGCDTVSANVAFEPWVALKIGPKTLIYSDDDTILHDTLAVDTGTRQFGLVYWGSSTYQVCSGVGVMRLFSTVTILRTSCVENPSILISGRWPVSGPATVTLTDRRTGTVIGTFTLQFVWPT